MPVYSCGGMRYQLQWEQDDEIAIPEDNQANIEATIQRAFELGINHIETARGYGTSERQLGMVLSAIPRDEFILQTKVPPMEDPREFEQALGKSLERLRMDHIDLFGFH